MQNSTLEEYRFIRSEMDSVKGCITTYTGYVLGGAGAAVLGIGALYGLDPSVLRSPELSVAAGALALSLLPTLVFVVLLYKFHSHNRFAGYCRLLGNEKPCNPGHGWDHLIPWEYCMGTLRYCDQHPEEWKATWRLAQFGGKESKVAGDAFIKYTPVDMKKAEREEKQETSPSEATAQPAGSPALITQEGQGRPDDKARSSGSTVQVKQEWKWKPDDKASWVDPIKTLVRCMFSAVSTRSWGFPAYITSVFAWVTAGFLMAGVGFGVVAMRGYTLAWAPLAPRALLLIAGVAVIAIQMVTWYKFARSVHCLLHGSATVNAYSWRFLPLRVRFLNELGVRPRYVLMAEAAAPPGEVVEGSGLVQDTAPSRTVSRLKPRVGRGRWPKLPGR